MAKRKNNLSTRKRFKWSSLWNWIPGLFGQSFAWFLFILFLIGSGFGVREVVFADAALQLHSLHVIPVDGLTVPKIQALQKKYLGRNTAQINLKAIAQDIETDHRVLSADVRRELPDRLEIHINRRTPFVYMHFGQKGRWAIVSRDAVVLDVVPGPAEGLYRVEDDQLGNQTPKIGMRLSRNTIDLTRVVDAFYAHAVSKSEKINSIAILPNDSAALYLADLSLKLNLDDPHPEQAFDKFQYLLETENRAMIEYVDLRFNRVILKRKTETREDEPRRNKKR